MKIKALAAEMANRKQSASKRKQDLSHVPTVARGSKPSGAYEDHVSDSMALAIDNKASILRIYNQIERLIRTKDVNSFFQDIAPDMATKLALMVDDPTIHPKIKVEIMRDLMDRAGYGKVTKHVTANLNVKDSKEAIISHIMGAKKELASAGIEIVDDDEDQPEET